MKWRLSSALKDYALAICCKNIRAVYIVMIYVFYFYASSKTGKRKSKDIWGILLGSSSKTFIHIKE